MGDLRSIDGGKTSRAKTLAKARVLECGCGSRRMREERIGVMLGPDGRVIHKGTKIYVCGQCGKPML